MAGPDLIKTLLYTVNNLLQQQKYKAALAVLKGFRNGVVYGAKIRAPHALVMTFLFKSGRSTCTCCRGSCSPCLGWP
ncbi:peroxisomal membrane protein 4 isoform X2 [Echeneis naucrates]|uniref:peroxisomal membrane protein 4 isoform X2 n=1 Tax=Echeneis naucrates TaxID=173247 RepID=UPI001114163A|nr:peroxisomal membrane protein 4 isoform X2 [Echeneis naucrates]